MGTGKRIVLLTVSMVVLAGVLSGAAALWHTLRISNSYHEIVEAELEEKGLVYGQVAMAFVNVLGPDALAVIQTIVNPAPGEPRSPSQQAAFDKFEGIEAWSPDASAPGGYRRVFRQEFDGAESPSHDNQTVLRLVAETRSTGSPAAAVDEEDQHIHISLPISLDENSRIIVVGTLSAEDEFAFFEGRYRADIRNGILVSVGIIAFVSVLGAGLAVFVSRDLTSRRRVEDALRESENRTRLIIEGAPDALVIADSEGRIMMVNTRAESMFGYQRHELLGEHVKVLLPDRFREVHARHRADYSADPHPRQMGDGRTDLVGLRKDGTEFPVEISLSAMQTKDGIVIAAIRDITERKRAEETLRLQGAALDATANGVVITDHNGRFTWVNPAFTRLTGYSREEAVGQKASILKSGKQDRAFYEQLWRTVLAGRFWRGELINRRKDGSLYTEEQTITPVLDERGAITHFIAIKQDITNRKHMEDALREQTRRDPLTGVLNHAAIVEELRGVLAQGEHVQCAVAMVDVDGMKATNDTFGHQVGDQVLLRVAQAMSGDGAIVGRYGGDEFVSILHATDRNTAKRYRDAVAERLGEAPIIDEESGLAVPVSVSMGLAIYPEEAQTVTDLLKLSDNAMYASRLRRPVGRAREAMPRRRDEQAAKMVGEMVPLLTSEGSLSDKLRLVAHRLCVGAGYDAVNFELLSPETGELLAASSFGFVPEEQSAAWERYWDRVGANRPLIAVVERTLRPLIVNDADSDARVGEAERALLRGAGLRSLLIAPMCWQERLAGLLTVLSKKGAAFGPRDAQFVTAVATQVSAIARMAMLLEQLQSVSARLTQSHEETILLLASAAEAHDRTMGEHFHDVRQVTEALARELGHPEDECREMGLAAALHDVGKIRLPDGILVNSGPLNREEWELMKNHTVWGQEFLTSRAGFELAATIARSHHERWDGAGYPDGLAGEAIPEAAAITAVADAFDAMTSDRSYRSALPVGAAVCEIFACSGTQFSPHVVEALLRLQDAGALARLSEPDAGQRAA